jgi:capsular polysaccharide transport system permease protein
MHLVDHLLIIRALLLRDLRLKYLHQPSGFAVEILRPALACIIHYFVFWAVGKQMPAGVSLEQFIWPAFAVWLTIMRIYQGLQQPARSQAPRLLGASRMHMRLAMCTWAVIINALFFYASVTLMILFGDNVAIPDVPLTAFIMLLAAALGLGMGLIVEGVCRVMPLLEPVFHLLPYFMFLGSGIYYSLQTAPPAMGRIFTYSPIANLVEYERYAFNPGYPIARADLLYAVLCTAALLLLGLALNRRIRYKAAA